MRKLLIALAALAAAPAFAQALGTVTSVNGVATVTTGAGGTTLVQGAQVLNGSRIVTTSASSVTLSLNDGCTVNVPPAHAVTLLSSMTCRQVQAAVLPVASGTASVPATAVMGQTGTLGGLDPAVAIWGAAVIATAIYDAVRDRDEPEEPISGR